MKGERIIALLGRRDEPTDAVEEYCRYLGQALVAHGFQLEIRRVPWNECGWGQSLNALRLQAQSWRGVSVLVQYTALAWSSRGFPSRFLNVLRILRLAGARIIVVFHDVAPFGGTRWIDRLRRAHQVRIMRAAHSFADQAVLTVALDRVPWLRPPFENATFLQVGANFTTPQPPQDHDRLHSPPAIGVFSVTGGASGDRETQDIIAATRLTAEKLGPLRLLVFGRHAELREDDLRRGLQNAPVELVVEGVVDETALIDRFLAIDVLLFVRGTISSRRGSAIAGIACGVPVIAFEGPETAFPIRDSGVVLLREESDGTLRQRQLSEALVTLFSDERLRADLIQRNHSAQRNHFSWSAIASGFAKIL